MSRSQLSTPAAVKALSGLAHPQRLAVFRLLVRAGVGGLAAGEIAREIGILPNTMSAYLSTLSHAGLVHAQRDGRSIIYAVDYETIRDLLGFLIDECCGGRPEICDPFFDMGVCQPSAPAEPR